MDEVKSKLKQNQNAAHIAMEYNRHSQSNHSSPYHVHPYPSPVRLQHAFQNSPQGTPKMFHPKGLHKACIDARAYSTPNESPILGRALCLTPKGSPIPGRVSHLNEKFQDSLTLTSDTDSLVAKISAMFPTVSETHIKILLKKYYNREAVVISALQVEKHPITTPGPLSMSPSVSRLQKGAVGVYSALQLAKGVSVSTHGSSHHLTPLSVTPQGSPSLLRPDSSASYVINYHHNKSADTASTKTHHSPKMKLKYLNNIFPKADETLILDVLCNKDNNVQKATEELLKMGFTKKETIVTKPAIKKEIPQAPKKVVTIMKTTEEKEALKKKIAKKYPKVPDKVISIALDSVGFNEERAIQILSSVVTEEQTPKKICNKEEKHITKTSISQASIGFGDVVDAPKNRASLAPASPAFKTRVKNWTERLKPILKSTSTNIESKYKSSYSSVSNGPNPQMRMGPKEGLLLEDYMAWKGPNPENYMGSSVIVEGPDQRDKRPVSLARGSNPNLSKGPQGLAKGSIYQKISNNNSNMCVR